MAMCNVPGPQATACEAAPRSFSRSSVLLREGERSNAFLFVKSGLLAVRQTGLDGVDRAIAVIGPGFLIGQPAAHGLSSLVTVQALTPVSVCEFPLSTLQRLSQLGQPDLICLGRYTRQSMAALAAWSHLMRMPGLSQRLASALRLLAAIQPSLATQLPSQAMLAELLCVTRESVNRAWREFESRGVVRRRHRRAVDLDVVALERLSVGAD